jgi:hypothetical protein
LLSQDRSRRLVKSAEDLDFQEPHIWYNFAGGTDVRPVLAYIWPNRSDMFFNASSAIAQILRNK